MGARYFATLNTLVGFALAISLSLNTLVGFALAISLSLNTLVAS